MIKEELKIRALPDVLSLEDGTRAATKEQWEVRRAEIAQILQHEYCGFEPPLHAKVEGKVSYEDSRFAIAGKAVYQKVDVCCQLAGGSFTFPCQITRPKGAMDGVGTAEQFPVFVYISFSSAMADELLPLEEIIDNGFAVASFYYQDIAPDTDDKFANGIATAYGRNPFDSWGKVRMWAWAASRVMDHLQTVDWADKKRIAVVGHSRLGKTALLAGAFDERFSLTISNDSGGAGAAIFRGKTGEMVKNFRGGTSGHWFAGNFRNYVRRESEMPFDMHYLLSMVAPRNLYVCSAKEDAHADPKSEFLSCAAASEVYEAIFHMDGLVTEEDTIPEEAVVFPAGNIGYHMRNGHHFLSRYDWQRFMEYRNMPEHVC